MGTFGTGPFGSDGALDLLDELASQSADQRREALERIFSQVRDHPDLLGQTTDRLAAILQGQRRAAG